MQVSLAIGYPTAASAPHSIANGLKNLMAIAAETDKTFPATERLKPYLADPSAFAVAAAPNDLRFHHLHGKNARIGHGGVTAARPNALEKYNDSIVLSN